MINTERQKRIDDLCKLIGEEEDHSKMTELARELDELLEAKAKLPTSHNLRKNLR